MTSLRLSAVFLAGLFAVTVASAALADRSAPASSSNFSDTGGISALEAAWRAGADEPLGPWRSFYNSALHTWFFTAADGRALALENVPVEASSVRPGASAQPRPDSEPEPRKWLRHELPALDAAVPSELGRGENGTTLVQLDSTVFGALLPVASSGPTIVPAEKLWRVLDCAREKKLRLRFVVKPPSEGEAHAQLYFSPAEK